MAKKPKADNDALADEDAALWHRIAKTAKPLAGRSPPPKPKAPAKSPPKAEKPKRQQTVTPPTPPPSRDLPELTKGRFAGVDKRTAARLKSGKMAIDGRIDLHGMTQAEAALALTSFLRTGQAAGRRTVLVITGKGFKPGGRSAEERTGVLRRMVPRWLNQPENRARIVAVAQAQPKDGGAGALYVLLRRLRGAGV